MIAPSTGMVVSLEGERSQSAADIAKDKAEVEGEGKENEKQAQ